jgi:diguanylate cyclase (GGDEF)-like protein
MKSAQKSASPKSPAIIENIIEKTGSAREASGSEDRDVQYLIIPAQNITPVEQARLARQGFVVSGREDLLDRLFKLEEENRHLKNLSIKDGLTGLYNRRFFNGQLKVEISRTRRTGESFCLIFIDLDNFKAVNDTLGHTKGDEFLIEISRRMKTKVRPTDFACRFGGDEFAVILPATTLSDAVKIAGRWHQNIGQAAAGMHLGVSASIGVDEFDVTCRLDAQEFIHRVDQRLYQAKKEGRGKIVHPEIKKREDKAVTWEEKEILFHIFQPSARRQHSASNTKGKK